MKTYRADIDGLRAVAVLPIVLFHAGLDALPGGFIGVDIFFVISGFLITRILIGELDSGQFSLWAFYKRRMTRIFPALFVMLAAVSIVSTIVMFPGEIRDAGNSVAAAAAFASNIYFWSTADYFSTSADTKPLLHTWSLGVEEQFYLIFPLLLLGICKFGHSRYRPWIVGFSIVSFVASLIMVGLAPRAAFYLLPSRAWELGLGAIVAVGAVPTLARQSMRSAMAIIGIAAIGYGLIGLKPSDPFPGWNALYPAIGAMLVIAYGQHSPVGMLLSWAPARWVGKVSYSLYLWHWPIIVCWRLETGPAITRIETLGLVTASLIAAFASYRLIEQPCLNKFRDAVASKVVAIGAAATVAIAAGGIVLATNSENWRQYPAGVKETAAYIDYLDWDDRQPWRKKLGQCFISSETTALDKTCLAPDPQRRNVLIVGDSHAMMYWLAAAEKTPSANVMLAAASDCRPAVNALRPNPCADLMQFVFGRFIVRTPPDHVVLGGNWQTEDMPQLRRTLAILNQRKIRTTVIGPTITYNGDVPSLLARAVWRGDETAMRDNLKPDRFIIDRHVATTALENGADYISVITILCPTRVCRLRDDSGAPLQYDYGHLTEAAAKIVVSQFPPL